MSFLLGLDIGGTKMEAAVLSQKDHLVLARKRIPTERDQGLESVYSRMLALIHSVLKESNTRADQLASIGIGLPGAVSPKTKQMLNGNTDVFVGYDLAGTLKKDLAAKCQVEIANDANCFALAEALWGAGKVHAQNHHAHVNSFTSIGIILGTGVGGGLVVQGEALIGKNGGAGEIGHTQLDSQGELCFCSRRGCAESYLSGKGLENWFFKKYNKQLSSQDIFTAATSADKDCQEAIAIYKNYLDEFLLNLINFFDPDFLVLGGGVSLQPTIYDRLEERIWKRTFIPNGRPSIYQNKLGDSAGVIGAALLKS